MNKNFKWLVNDIYFTLVLKVVDNNNDFEIYNVSDILDITLDKLDVRTANIDDLTNFLNFGIVRFISEVNNNILDIPFRNMYKLYNNSNFIGDFDNSGISFSDLEIYSVIDDDVRNDLIVLPLLVDKVSNDLECVMKIASEFSTYGMQDKIDAMNSVTLINHRRLIKDDKNRIKM